MIPADAPERLDPSRTCPICRLALNGPPAVMGMNCTRAHFRAAQLSTLLTLLDNSAGDEPSARAYVRALSSYPLQLLVDLLRWHTDRMDPTIRRGWHQLLVIDPREVVNPTVCPAAQLWQAMLDRVGPRALLAVASPVIRASMGLVAHVCWPHGVDWLKGETMVRLCDPADSLPVWHFALDAMPDVAVREPWQVTCPDCVDLLPMLDAIMAVRVVGQ